jgi:hypothetical protein
MDMIKVMPSSQRGFKKEIKRRLKRWDSQKRVFSIDESGNVEPSFLIFEIPGEVQDSPDKLRFYFLSNFGKHLPYGWEFSMISAEGGKGQRVRWLALRRSVRGLKPTGPTGYSSGPARLRG